MKDICSESRKHTKTKMLSRADKEIHTYTHNKENAAPQK